MLRFCTAPGREQKHPDFWVKSPARKDRGEGKGNWGISPVQLWEKAHWGISHPQLRNAAPQRTAHNQPCFNQLQSPAEKMKNASGKATFVHLSLPEAVVNRTLTSLNSLKPILVLLVVLLWWVPKLAADEHPVEIPKDTDCATCHEDKTKGKAVHSAIAMGCTSCHEVKTEKGTTTVNLTSPKDQLCFTCHDKSKDADLHAPYEAGQCTTCHDPHTSDYPKQLRAELNGNFCLECHGPRKEVPEKVAIFKSQEMTKDQFNSIPKIYLSADLMRDHPVDKHPTQGMPNPLQPEAKMTCTTCHAIHSAPNEKLLPAADKEGRDVCTQCHLVVDSAKEAVALKEGGALDAKRLEELRKKNPDAGKPAPKRRVPGGEN
jgi:predicted CXXCH cytochrome family protein